jgi:hypothetical protein
MGFRGYDDGIEYMLLALVGNQDRFDYNIEE